MTALDAVEHGTGLVLDERDAAVDVTKDLQGGHSDRTTARPEVVRLVASRLQAAVGPVTYAYVNSATYYVG